MDKVKMQRMLVMGGVLVLVCAVIVGMARPSVGKRTEFLRIHIRADSNLAADQNVKYDVKEAVIAYLVPRIAECETKSQAEKVLKSEIGGITAVANAVLAAQGFDYRATARLSEEAFPDRTYDGTTLPAGIYDALLINLGSGSGDNWWCVVYPPLCFQNAQGTASDGITYKSKIAEIIKKAFNK